MKTLKARRVAAGIDFTRLVQNHYYIGCFPALRGCRSYLHSPQALPYQYQKLEFTRDKHIPRFPHQPTLISKAARRTVEDNRDDFFQRLYDIRLQHYDHRVTAMRDINIATAQVVNTVHPRVLTEEQRRQASDRYVHHHAKIILAVYSCRVSALLQHPLRTDVIRLLKHKVYTTQKANDQRQEHCSTLKQQQNNRHTKGRSHKLATQVHRKALSEIYDVLLVTAQLARDRLKAAETTAASEGGPASAPASGTDLSAAENGSEAPQQAGAAVTGQATTAAASNNTQQGQTDNVPAAAGATGEEGRDMLDTSLARAHFLQPKQLSDAIAVILSALSPRSVSRAQFIEFTLHCMHKTHDLQQQHSEQSQSQCEPPPGSAAASPAPAGASNASPAVGDRALPTTPGPALATGTGDAPHAPESIAAEPRTPQITASAPALAATPATTHKPLSAPSPRTSGTPLSRFTPPTTPRTASRGPSAANTPSSVVIPPIGYLLVAAKTGGSGTSTQQERQKGTQAQREYDAHFTGKPELAAQKTTERLAKQRYRDRSAGRQRVEDSLIACTIITSYSVVP
jgi:hypothetical protein